MSSKDQRTSLGGGKVEPFLAESASGWKGRFYALRRSDGYSLRGRIVRICVALLFLLVGFPILVYPAWCADKIPDKQKLSSLEQRAAEARPRDQYYLYAELVHDMVEYSAHQYASGDIEEAQKTLKRSQQFTHKIRTMLGENVKKLRRAQILLRRTAFRLTDLLHVNRYSDRRLIKETLVRVEAAQREAMLQVFEE